MPGPFDNWLTLRGAKTLAVRMERHCDNAERIAEMLAHHPAVARVLYPGLPEHPGHEVAAKQMRRFGGMVSFLPAGGREAALRVCAATELFILAESLGGVESLIEHPGEMTHMSVVRLGAGGARLAGAAVGGHRGRRRPDRGPAHRAGPRRRLTCGSSVQEHRPQVEPVQHAVRGLRVDARFAARREHLGACGVP